MHWHRVDDDYFMIFIPKKRAQQQLAAFAIHLSMGNNVYCRRIRLGTIKEYVNAVAHITALYRNEDIRKDNPLDRSMGTYLESVYAELKRWEDEPNRRESFTPPMLDRAHALALAAHILSLIAALADWFTIGLFAGLRCGEFAQTETQTTDPTKPALNERGQTRAFCLNDIRARTKYGKKLKGADILGVPVDHIGSLWIKWRTQKNQKHGVERLFRPSRKASRKCPVRALYRILERFVALRGPTDVDTPLSVYKAPDGRVCLITSDDITKHMRDIASFLYKLDPVKDAEDLQRWSAHSLRVGACVFLHAKGFGPIDIKWILRWESDAYKVYLRNFTGLSDRHTQAWDKLDDVESEIAMPHLDEFLT